MREVDLDFDRDSFLKFCTDPTYLEILNFYMDYLEENIVTDRSGDFYNSLYEGSLLDPLIRLSLMKKNGSLESVEKVAQDFGVEVSYSYVSPFILGESEVGSSDVLKSKYFRENKILIMSYTNYFRVLEFIDFYNKYMKPASLNTTVEIFY